MRVPSRYSKQRDVKPLQLTSVYRCEGLKAVNDCSPAMQMTAVAPIPFVLSATKTSRHAQLFRQCEQEVWWELKPEGTENIHQYDVHNSVCADNSSSYKIFIFKSVQWRAVSLRIYSQVASWDLDYFCWIRWISGRQELQLGLLTFCQRVNNWCVIQSAKTRRSTLQLQNSLDHRMGSDAEQKKFSSIALCIYSHMTAVVRWMETSTEPHGNTTSSTARTALCHVRMHVTTTFQAQIMTNASEVTSVATCRFGHVNATLQ